MMKNHVTVNDIAGYATPKTVWHMMLNLSDCCGQSRLTGIAPDDIMIVGDRFPLKDDAASGFTKAFAAPEVSHDKSGKMSEASDIWTIGALAFYAITGMNVFEGKGGETQTTDTEIPRISSAYAPHDLSNLIMRCLSYVPEDRPTIEEIRHSATTALETPVVAPKKLISQTGKSYSNSLIKFWPEEMGALACLCLLLIFPLHLFAQETTTFDKSVIPNEMATLVLRSIDLRLPQNTEKVYKEMNKDMNWTMMDELALDKNGECTTKEPVDVFGLNDIGFGILKRRGGVTNTGGRFRDGRDPQYKYSFIEITVRKGATVNYQISGREGEQLFAIVPYETDAQFSGTISNGESFLDNGICYIRLKQKIKKNDAFTLTLTNLSGKNMAFVLINYNSRNHE